MPRRLTKHVTVTNKALHTKMIARGSKVMFILSVFKKSKSYQDAGGFVPSRLKPSIRAVVSSIPRRSILVTIATILIGCCCSVVK
jgi:hypothetical protein